MTHLNAGAIFLPFDLGGAAIQSPCCRCSREWQNILHRSNLLLVISWCQVLLAVFSHHASVMASVHSKLFTLAGTLENRGVFWLALRVGNAWTQFHGRTAMPIQKRPFCLDQFRQSIRAGRWGVLRAWPDRIAGSVWFDSVMESDFLVSYAISLGEGVGQMLSNPKNKLRSERQSNRVMLKTTTLVPLVKPQGNSDWFLIFFWTRFKNGRKP